MADTAYAARIAEAMTSQGLDKVVARLAEAGVPHLVEQTGGWCMAVIVVSDRTHVTTSDDGESYVVGTYECWAAGGEPVDIVDALTLDEVVERLAAVTS